MVLSIASIIILVMLHYSSPMQNEHKHFNLLATVNEILVSHTETYESWYYDFKEIIFSKR